MVKKENQSPISGINIVKGGREGGREMFCIANPHPPLFIPNMIRSIVYLLLYFLFFLVQDTLIFVYNNMFRKEEICLWAMILAKINSCLVSCLKDKSCPL